MELQRRFSPFNMLLLSINGMIGSAWLFAPFYAARIAGSGTIIAWILGGAATILIALTFAEISTLFPQVGGSSHLPELSHGKLIGFIMSWVAWLSCVTMPPIEVQAVLLYTSAYFPSLSHIVNGAPVLTMSGLVWAGILMFALCVINIVSFKGLVRFNQFLSFFKLAIMFLTVLILIKTKFYSQNFTGTLVNFSSSWQTILAAVATGGIAFAFTGFKHGVELAGETKNSQFAIPLAIIGSVVGCLILYLGLQIAFLGALNPEVLKAGWDKISFAGAIGPFVGVAGILGLVWLAKLIYLNSIVSPLGAGLIYVTSTSRIVYAMSKNGYLSSKLTFLNKEGFPIWAIIFNFIVGMLLFLPLPGWQNMVSFLVSAVVISYAMGPVALLCFRKLVPHQQRAFTLPFANVSCFLAFYCCNLLAYWTGWETIYKLFIALIIGLGFFLISIIKNKYDWKIFGMRAAYWIMPYLSGILLISFLGSFGGKQIIPFGWDFLVIAIFSLLMLMLAVTFRAKHIMLEANN